MIARRIGSFAARVKARRAGIQQMDYAAVLFGFALEFVVRNALCGFGGPVGTHVSEDLRTVREQLHEKHTHAV